MPAYGHWIRTTRADFLRYLEGVLWKTGEVPRFDFPVAGVLPGTLLRVLSRPPVPVQPPLVRIEEIGPTILEQVLPSHPVIASVLPASPDSFLSLVLDSPCSPDNLSSLVGSPTCSLDILPSLANNVVSPSCSVDISTADPDNSPYLPENSYCLSEEPGLIVEKCFEDLSTLALSLSDIIGEAHYDYGLKGSEEEIIFYEEPIETPTSSTTETPSLAKGLSSLVLDSPSLNSMLELSTEQGESTSSVLGHGPTSRSFAWAICDPGAAHIGHMNEYSFYGLFPALYNP